MSVKINQAAGSAICQLLPPINANRKSFHQAFYGAFQLIRQMLPKSKPNQTKPLITFGCRRQIELTCVKVQRIDFLIGPKDPTRPDQNHKGKKPKGPLRKSFSAKRKINNFLNEFRSQTNQEW